MAITFNEYQELASRTANFEEEFESINYAMGLDGESGELIDGFKKFIFHAHPINKNYVKKEAGDVLWYASQLARLYNLSFDEAFVKLNTLKSTFEVIRDQGNPKRLTMVACLQLANASGEVSRFIDGERLLASGFYSVSSLRSSLDRVLRNLYALVILSGLTIEEVAEANIEKLKARYPEGFDPEKSINRVE